MSSFPLGRAGMQAKVQGADATLAEIVRRLVDAYSPLRQSGIHNRLLWAAIDWGHASAAASASWFQ